MHFWILMKFRNILLLCLVRRRYVQYGKIFFFTVASRFFLSRPPFRRRDFLSGKGKHANHKRRFKKTAPILRRDSTRIVHSANIVQPRPVMFSFSDSQSSRGKKLCFLLAQRAIRTSSFTREFVGALQSRRGAKSSEKFVSRLQRVKWKRESRKDRVTGQEMGQKNGNKKQKKKEDADDGGKRKNLLPRFARL